MNEIRKRAFVGIIGLVSAGLFSVGCGSSATTTGTGGSTGAAGHAGTTGAGGTSAGGGTTGAGGAAVACAAAPASGLIADFMGDGGIELGGAIFSYGGLAQPTHTISNGIFNVMENNGATSAFQYVGTLIGFTACVDASAFTGVSFSLGGSFSGCTIQYSTNDAPHDDMVTDPKGTCTLGSACYSPQAAITSVTSNAQVVMEPFITTAGGNPSAATDAKQLTGIQWQLTIAPTAEGGTPGTCMANLNISNVKFYH
jgi:hypothetical protein